MALHSESLAARPEEDVWIPSVCRVYKVMNNAQTAAAKGIVDGDAILLETPHGANARGIAKVSQCIHPEVVGIASCFGHWAKARVTARGRGIHFNSLIPYSLSQIDAMAGLMDACVKVKVSKVAKKRLFTWPFRKEALQ